MSINGARRNAVNWLVDGVSNVDVGSNITLLSTPTLESIEEFKIITNGYAAEWPRSGGGIVNVVTKSGTNAVPRQRLRVLPQRRAQRQLVLPQPEHATRRRTKPPMLRYNNFGYTVGGPIVPRESVLLLVGGVAPHHSARRRRSIANVAESRRG